MNFIEPTLSHPNSTIGYCGKYFYFLACHDSKKMGESNTRHGNGIDSRGINLEILIRDAYSGNLLIKINLY
jgi:hypothetical protein